MKLLIEIPTWLGDAIMATPAIENLLRHYRGAEVTIVGSYVATQLFINDERVSNIIVDNTKKSLVRLLSVYQLAKKAKDFDYAISFRSSFYSKLLLKFLDTKENYNFEKEKITKHQVLKYNDFLNKTLNTEYKASDLMLRFKPQWYKKPTLGINPGATYGSAKRWYPEEFAKVATELSKKYDIVIFGGPNETEMAADIEKILIENGVSNYENLAGKTTIPELIEKIAALDIFITNDSGPMHVAAVYKVNTIAIFGPTSFAETNQWKNPLETIVSKYLECSPCMKRTCPLKHHDCMKTITSDDVLKLINK